MALQASDIADLANTTLDELGRGRVEDIMTDLQDHVAFNTIYQQRRTSVGSGENITWNLLNDVDDNAKNIGLHAIDNTNIKDGVITQTVPWRHTTSSMAFDIRERAINSDPARILDIVKVRRQMCLGGLVALKEQNFWDGPADSTDETTPYGLFKYWLSYNATEGFNGGNHSNWSSGPGGKSATTYSRLKHWTAQYTTANDTDLVRKIRTALVKTNFKPTVKNAPIPPYGSGMKRAMYADYTNVIRPLEELARSNNDSIGKDLAMYDGEVTIQRIPLIYVPYIEENKGTSCPVVGIDWSQVEVSILSGMWMKPTPFYMPTDQHNELVGHFDSSYNFVIRNRRKGVFLIAKSDPTSA